MLERQQGQPIAANGGFYLEKYFLPMNSLEMGYCSTTGSWTVESVDTEYDLDRIGTWIHYAVIIQKTIIGYISKPVITLVVNRTVYESAASWPNWVQMGHTCISNGASSSCDKLL